MRRLSAFALLALAALEAAANPRQEALLSAGHAAYFRGELTTALERYKAAVAVSSASVKPWLNGAAVLEELGDPKQALRWYESAAALPAPGVALEAGSAWDEPPTRSDVHAALGWAQFRIGSLLKARASFKKALASEPSHPAALTGLGRTELELGHPAEGAKVLSEAARAAPLSALIPYFLGLAYNALPDPIKAIESLRQAVKADSYFIEARAALVQAQFKRRQFNEAWTNLSKIADVEPSHKGYRALLTRMEPLLSKRASELRPAKPLPPFPFTAEASAENPRVPRLRVGLATTSLGKPQARNFVAFSVTAPGWILDARGHRLASLAPARPWSVRLKRVKKRVLLEISGEGAPLSVPGPIVIRTQDRAKGLVILDNLRYAVGHNWSGIADKSLRGELEIGVARGGRALRLVNVIDLENYTHGVVSAEMPIRSPQEALKAQAVIARSHALHIREVTKRHSADGYDVCDEQHCQVYQGARAESRQSRAVVEATRGMIAAYKGRVAHVIYSSNCGGHTQSGRDVTGWGDLPYWLGVPDSETRRGPSSPWELRRWLASAPAAYCKPSTYVHASHFRWSRLIPFKDLQDKLDRRYRTGKILAIVPGRRSSAGNLNSLTVRGSRRTVKINSEMAIRSGLSIGSMRSTLFVFHTEYGPGLKPRALLFQGGGWGHGVGLCQSGAMGRAEAGQSYAEIVTGFFKGTEITKLNY